MKNGTEETKKYPPNPKLTPTRRRYDSNICPGRKNVKKKPITQEKNRERERSAQPDPEAFLGSSSFASSFFVELESLAPSQDLFSKRCHADLRKPSFLCELSDEVVPEVELLRF